MNFIDDWWYNLDKKIFFIYIFLCLFGLIAILTAGSSVAFRIGMKNEYSFFIKQTSFLVLSIVVCIVISTFDSKKIKFISKFYFFISFFLLFLVPFKGEEYKGAKRWLLFHSISIQPMEFVKTATVLFLALRYSLNNRQNEVNKFLTDKLAEYNDNRLENDCEIKEHYDLDDYEKDISEFGVTKNEFKIYLSRFDLWKTNLMCLLFVIIVFILLLYQPDLGNTILLFTVLLYQFSLYKSIKITSIIKMTVLISIVVLPIIYISFPHFKERINNYFESVLNIEKAMYQIKISSFSYMNAGFMGKGFLSGEVKNHIPDAHTDFIFPVITEEFGFIIALFLLCIYFYISIRILLKSLSYKDDFVFYSLNGFSILFILQTVINVSVSLNLSPAKGITLPLLSYGGSSIVSSSILFGFILAMTKKNQQNFYKDKYFIWEFNFDLGSIDEI